VGAPVPPEYGLPHAVIEPSALRAAKAYLFILEAQVHPLTVVIPRFIQMHMPLPPLRLTVQSRRGVIQILEVQTHSLTKAISKFIQKS
jgi:hypothetical protein